jgi:hypothetical protein
MKGLLVVFLTFVSVEKKKKKRKKGHGPGNLAKLVSLIEAL